MSEVKSVSQVLLGYKSALEILEAKDREASSKGKLGIRKKSDAKCENIAHIDNKFSLIMAKVIAPVIKGKH